MTKLKADGSLAVSVETDEMTKTVIDALLAYQIKHNLPCGNLNEPTMDKLGIKIVQVGLKKTE